MSQEALDQTVAKGVSARIGSTNRSFASLLFGYDIFLSFALGTPPRGVQSYASDLARRMRERNFNVFFSEEEAPPGEHLDSALRKALRRSKTLVVIANRGTLEDPRWVRKEVEEYRKQHPDRPVIPINIGGALQDPALAASTQEWLRYSDKIWLDETEEAAIAGIVSEPVAVRLASAPAHYKVNMMWQWAVRSVIAVFIALSIVLAIAWKSAFENAELALQQLRTANLNLAAAHEEKALGILNLPEKERNTRDYQRALLQVLQAQRQQIGDEDALSPMSVGRLARDHMNLAFTSRWALHALNGGDFAAVAFSPNGHLLASTEDNTVRLWDSVSGELKQILSGHDEEVTAIAFSQDGRRLASASVDGTVRLWDPVSGESQQPLPGYEDEIVTALAFRPPDGRLLATGSGEGTVRLWDLPSADVKGAFPATDGSVSSLAFSSDGRFLASGSELPNAKWQLWDLQGGTFTHGEEVFNQDVSSVAFNSYDGSMAIAWSEGVVTFLDPVSSEFKERSVSGHDASVTSVAFSPSEPLFAVGFGDGTIYLWSMASGEPNQTLSGHQKAVKSLAFSPDGALLASTSVDEAIQLWDVHTVEGPRQITPDVEDATPVTLIAFSPDGRLLAGAPFEGSLQLWNMDSGEPENFQPECRWSINSFVFSSDGRLLACGSKDGTVEIWDTVSRQTKQILSGHEGSVNSVAFSPDNRQLASASADRVRLWELDDGELKSTMFPGHKGSVTSVAFSPDGRRLASASADMVRLWELDGSKRSKTLDGYDTSVTTFAFSPDGLWLAVGFGDGTIWLWNMVSDEHEQTLSGHKDTVNSLAFSSDGLRLASASADETVRLWEPVSGQLRQTLNCHGGSVNSVAISSDGQLLACASDDGSVRFWDYRIFCLLDNGTAPSARATLISEILQRLWGLRVDRINIVPEPWDRLRPRNGHYVDEEISVPIGPAMQNAGVGTKAKMRMFNIRPLLYPPKPGEDKLDQLMSWLKVQGM